MPVHIAFLGCGFITGVHSRHLKALRDDVVRSYASRDGSKAQACCRRYRGAGSYDSYTAAIEDPAVDAVVVAVPPRFHLDLTLQALSAGKHVLVEKPAYLRMEDYLRVQSAREGAGRVVLVGENDHYKPLAVCLRRLLREGVIGEMVFAHYTTLVKRFKRRRRLAERRDAGRWRRVLRGGDSLAAPRQQPRPRDDRSAGLSTRRRTTTAWRAGRDAHEVLVAVREHSHV